MTDTHGTSSMKIGWIEKGTGEHQSNQVYSRDGCARALQARDWKGSMMVDEESD